jgi:alcohol dehydrogenase class IV
MRTDIIFGLGSISEIVTTTKNLGVESPLLVTDSFLSGTNNFKQLVENIRKRGFNPTVWGKAVPNPTDVSVNEGIKVYREGGCDGLIGFGGGSSMDTAKAIGVLAYHNEDDINPFFNKPPSFKSIKKICGVQPVVCIPTTAGTGAEVSIVATITEAAINSKRALKSNILSKVAIVDPRLSVSMPPKITAATGIDALCHAFEAYTAKRASPLSDAFAFNAIRLVAENLRTAVFNGENIEARNNMSLAALMAGIAFQNAPLHLVHIIGYILLERYHIPHGISMGFVLPEVMEFILPACTQRLAAIAPFFKIDTNKVSQRKAAEMTIQEVFQLVKDIGVPSIIESTDVSLKDLSILADLIVKKFPFTMSPRAALRDDYYWILQKAYNRNN